MAIDKITPAGAEPTPSNTLRVVGSGGQHPAPTAHFHLGQFFEREQRRTARLLRAAWGVGATHEWFVAAPRDYQVIKVREWVEAAQLTAAARRVDDCWWRK